MPQPRPRAARNGHVYDNGRANPWKHTVRAAARAAQIAATGSRALPVPDVASAFAVTLRFRMPRPPSHLRADGSLRPAAPRRHVGRPDIDNLAKAVLDALGEFDGALPLVWGNDSQVVLLEASKDYAGGGAAPGVEVLITNDM